MLIQIKSGYIGGLRSAVARRDVPEYRLQGMGHACVKV